MHETTSAKALSASEHALNELDRVVRQLRVSRMKRWDASQVFAGWFGTLHAKFLSGRVCCFRGGGIVQASAKRFDAR
jgi:hypothetical protein